MTKDMVTQIQAAASLLTLDNPAATLIVMNPDGKVHLVLAGENSELLWISKQFELVVEKLMQGIPLK